MTTHGDGSSYPGSSPAATTNFQGKQKSSNITPSRLRKREMDRFAQRQKRERTKSRIAYLEGLVEQYREESVGEQQNVVVRQLTKMEHERDSAVKVLRNIWHVVNAHSNKYTAASFEDGGKEWHDETISKCEPMTGATTPDQRDVVDDTGGTCSLTRASGETSTLHIVDKSLTSISSLAGSNSQPVTTLHGPAERLPSSSNEPIPNASLAATVRQREGKEDNGILDFAFRPSSYTANWAVTAVGCSCGRETQPRTTASSTKDGGCWRGNQWTFANEVLGERLSWNEGEVQCATDVESDDVPIRAVLEGWHSIIAHGRLHPTWQILRRIDQMLFSLCPPVERLAILRSMHTLLQFHTEPTEKRYRRLPPWYVSNPRLQVPRSYATEYFAWQGLRDRVARNEHRYCGNEFWTLFCSSLNILWPYSFRDCFMRENETGLYRFSPLFDQRLRDIQCWTMGPDVFSRFPELYGDIPAYGSIPKGLSQAPVRDPGMVSLGRKYPDWAWNGTVSKRPPADLFLPAKDTTSAEEDLIHRTDMPSASVQALTEGFESAPCQFDPNKLDPIMTIDALMHGIIDGDDLETVFL